MKRSLFVIAIALTAASTSSVDCCCAEEVVPLMGPRVPYDRELYVLSYDVFLANSNPAEAFLLAEKAVTVRPGDMGWRRKAAQSAEWSGNASRALGHWYFLALETGQRDAIENAFRLSRALGDGSRLKLLLENRGFANSPALLREYVSVCELAGMPEDAIIGLEKQRRSDDRLYVLEQLARLYEAVGRNNDAITALLELSSELGIRGKDLLKAASLSYAMGDIQASYTILSLGRQLSATETDYWKTYADLAWALQDMSATELASKKLQSANSTREVDFQRLIMINREKLPYEAYDLALQAWKQYGKSEYLTNLLEIGISQKRHKELAALLSEAEKTGKLETLQDAANFWSLVAQIYRGTGNISASVRSYQKALKLAPTDGSLAAGYIWLLLDLDQRVDLRRVLEVWKGREKSIPELVEPFGSAYAHLGDNSRALIYFQSIYRQKRNDPAWLAAYADTLEQSGWPEAAFVERLRALHLARKRMNSETAATTDDKRTLQLDYARLAMLLVPGDSLDNVVQRIIRLPQDETSRQLIAAWALSSRRSDLARIWYWREYARMTERPRWVELSLALEENDQPRIAKLLEYDLERLAYRDAIEGAQRVGWTPLAETHAFENFQINDRDHQLDQQIRNLYSSYPGWLRYRVSLIDQGGVGFLEQQVSLAAPLSKRYALRIEAGNTDLRTQKSDVLRQYPSSLQNAQVGLLIRHEKGTAELMAGLRDALSRHAMYSLVGDWKIDNRSSLNLGLYMGAVATESVPLQIAGQKNEVTLSLLNALTPRDNLMLKVSGRTLLDQEQWQLGKGAAVESELTHRLLASWPDTSLRLFGGYHYYKQTGLPRGKTLSMIPATSTQDASFYVPAAFSQSGIGISIGQEGRYGYIRDWRPFGAADMIWNSTNGVGFRYEVGMLGPVFGLDNLEFAFEQDSGAFGRSDITTRFDMRYRYHFK